MTTNAIIARYAEVFLKRGRRAYFVRLLRDSLRRQVSSVGPFKVQDHHGFLLVVHRDAKGGAFPEFEVDEGLDAALKRTFGMVSYSPCQLVPREISVIEKAIHRIAAEDVKGAATFKVDSSRSDKEFPLNSMDLNCRLGAIVADVSRVGVRLKDPEVTVSCRNMSRFAALYVDVVRGHGGLPVGSAGRVALLLSGGIDSPVAGFLAMRRGCTVDAIHFESAPYTTPQARGKVVDLSRMLAAYERNLRLKVVPFGAIQADLRDNAPGKLLVLLYRRFMIRIATRLAGELGALALVTGENLGQVASQTLENIAAIEAVSSLPVLRPLITWDKMETVALARSIGTYETSILPYDDCCSLFVPRHPETAAQADVLENVETGFDVEKMVTEAVAATETLEFRPTSKCEPSDP